MDSDYAISNKSEPLKTTQFGCNRSRSKRYSRKNTREERKAQRARSRKRKREESRQLQREKADLVQELQETKRLKQTYDLPMTRPMTMMVIPGDFSPTLIGLRICARPIQPRWTISRGCFSALVTDVRL